MELVGCRTPPTTEGRLSVPAGTGHPAIEIRERSGHEAGLQHLELAARQAGATEAARLSRTAPATTVDTAEGRGHEAGVLHVELAAAGAAPANGAALLPLDWSPV